MLVCWMACIAIIVDGVSGGGEGVGVCVCVFWHLELVIFWVDFFFLL